MKDEGETLEELCERLDDEMRFLSWRPAHFVRILDEYFQWRISETERREETKAQAEGAAAQFCWYEAVENAPEGYYK